MQAKELIIHCSATEEGKDFGASDIDKWHRQQGYNGIGYHFVVKLDGTVQSGRACNQDGAHCYGHNKYAIGVCYIGGLRKGKPADTRTDSQKDSLVKLIRVLMHAFSIKIDNVRVHNEFADKACPCFTREQFLQELATHTC